MHERGSKHAADFVRAAPTESEDAHRNDASSFARRDFEDAACRSAANPFPPDFLIELKPADLANLMSQNATSSWGGRRKRPLAFTEHGAIMAASVLNAPRAVEMSVFVALREAAAGHLELKQHLETLERQVNGRLAVHDEAIAEILGAIRALMAPSATR